MKNEKDQPTEKTPELHESHNSLEPAPAPAPAPAPTPTATPEETKPTTKRGPSKRTFVTVISIAAACLLFVLGAAGGVWLSNKIGRAHV